MRDNRNFDGREYFWFEERYNPRTNIKWVFIKDNTNVIWAMWASYKRAKECIPILVSKYRKVLEQRGIVVKEQTNVRKPIK